MLTASVVVLPVVIKLGRNLLQSRDMDAINSVNCDTAYVVKSELTQR